MTDKNPTRPDHSDPDSWTGTADVETEARFAGPGASTVAGPHNLGPSTAAADPPADRLAVGSHVVQNLGAVGYRYGIVLEAVDVGADEPAYRVGWLDVSPGLVTESDLSTVDEHAAALADEDR